MNSFGQWRILAWIFCLLLVSGCGSKLPRTVAVSGPELEQAQAELDRFLEKSCVSSIDSDVRLEWQAYGQQGIYPATVQAASPAYFRFAVVDPLGRPVLLLVIDGRTFTLVDNKKGAGYTGRLDSDFIRRYLPESVSGADLFLWISGQVRQEGLRVLSARRAADGEVFWYEIDYGDRLLHLLALEHDQLVRHLVLDAEGTVIFDVQYRDYSATPADCGWPGKITVAGKAMAADFTLEFTRMYSFSPLPEQLFHLQLPQHFTVHQLQ